MKRGNTEHIADAIMRMLRQEGLETPLNEFRIVDAWNDVVGPAIARYTRNVFIKNQTLYVQVASSVIRQELLMNRELLMRHLNNRVGAQVIYNIVFYLTCPFSLHTSSIGVSKSSCGSVFSAT